MPWHTFKTFKDWAAQATTFKDRVPPWLEVRDFESSIITRRGPRHDKVQQDRYDALAGAGTPMAETDWPNRPTA